MKPALKRDDAPMSSAQLEITKATIAATAQITSSMVAVTQEKNPAKISEAFRVIYKTIQEVVKGTAPKNPSGSGGSGSGSGS
jgi:glucose-6-phosphate dehydrogenase assembly protein OpcA